VTCVNWLTYNGLLPRLVRFVGGFASRTAAAAASQNSNDKPAPRRSWVTGEAAQEALELDVTDVVRDVHADRQRDEAAIKLR
jgi:hypothetical protein